MDQSKRTLYLRATTSVTTGLGAGSWLIIVALLSLLVATGFVAYFGWTLGAGAEVPTSGYVAMALGVILSLAVGFGLMALLFYSSRSGYDDPPVLITAENAFATRDRPDLRKASVGEDSGTIHKTVFTGRKE